MKTIEWIKKLVSFDTTSRNSNLALIHVIADWFQTHNISVRLTHDISGKKANLFATLPAQDGTVNGGIVLSGHTDVVPVDGQQWDTDPFVAVQKNERIYGRGTSDMKSFIAVILALLPDFLKTKLREPLHFAFSYDEEVGCLGAPLLITDFQQQGIQPRACIVGEPTEMRPVIAHKGINVFHCRVHGKAAHSSLTTKGCNAIEYAARLICHIRDLADELRLKGPQDEFYDVPFTSMTTNTIHGGTASNIIPEFCEFSFEFRNLPLMQPQDLIAKMEVYIRDHLLPKMKQETMDADIELDFKGSVPGLEGDEKSAIIALARALTHESKKLKVSYATEGGLFQQAGIPTIICGPGNIEQAHRPNEFVMLEQLQKCEAFLRALSIA